MVKEEVLKKAWPFISELLPSVEPPSLNVTMPVGVPMPGLTTETVAVKVDREADGRRTAGGHEGGRRAGSIWVRGHVGVAV